MHPEPMSSTTSASFLLHTGHQCFIVPDSALLTFITIDTPLLYYGILPDSIAAMRFLESAIASFALPVICA